jgi:signal peptidase II
MLFYALILLVVGIDQWVKYYVRTTMDLYESFPLIDGVINMTSHRNPGAAFGILAGQQWFFLLSTVAVVGVVLYYRCKGELKGRPVLETGLALLVAGAIGNAIDRVMFGEVTDFFDLQFIDFAIFNVADIAINVAVGLMVLSALFEGRRARRVSEQEES